MLHLGYEECSSAAAVFSFTMLGMQIAYRYVLEHFVTAVTLGKNVLQDFEKETY